IVHAGGEFASFNPQPLPVLPDWSPVAPYGGYYRHQPKTGNAKGGQGHALLGMLAGLSCAGAMWGSGCDCFLFRSILKALTGDNMAAIRSIFLATFIVAASVVCQAGVWAADPVKEQAIEAPNKVTIKVRMEGPYTAEVPLQVVCYFKYTPEGVKRMSGFKRHHSPGVHRPPAAAAPVARVHGPARDRLALLGGHLSRPRLPCEKPGAVHVGGHRDRPAGGRAAQTVRRDGG